MKPWCLASFRHSWEQWCEPYPVNVAQFLLGPDKPAVQHSVYRQDRKCIICGLAEKRRVKVEGVES